MKHIRKGLRYLGIYALLLAVLLLGQILCAAIPNAAIQKNMRASALRYEGLDRYEFTGSEMLSSLQDNQADLIWLNIAWHMGTRDPVTGALDTAYYSAGSLAGSLYQTVVRDFAPNTDYSRYWHGTAALLRPLLLFTDADGIKLLGMAVLAALLALTAILLIKRGHGSLALALVASLLAVQIWQLRLSIEYQPAFLLALGLCPPYLLAERRGDSLLPVLSLAGGLLTAFFDFLTTETVTLLLPLILVAAVRVAEGRLGSRKRFLALAVVCGICWLGAYGLAFPIKWLAVSLLTGENRLSAALSSMLFRVNGQVQPVEGPVSQLWGGLAANLTVLFGGTERIDGLQIFQGILLTGALLLWLLHRFRSHAPVKPGSWLLAAMGLPVLLRFTVLGNHSYMHCFFTYRALAATFFGVLSAMVLNMERKKRGGDCRDGSDDPDALPE